MTSWFRRPAFPALLFAFVLALACLPKARILDFPDFKVFYVAAGHALGTPADMYRLSPDRYLYPPPAAILLTPFALAPWPLAAFLWHGLLALVLFFLASRSFAALLAMLLLSRYLAISFNYGQINLIVLLLLFAAGKYFGTKQGGVFAALAAIVKVYPAVFGLGLFLGKKWKSLATAFLAGTVLLFLPFLFYGAEGSALYRDFFQALRDKGLPLYSHNQSISALLLRLLTPTRFDLHAVGPVEWGIASLSPLFVRGLALCIGLVLSAFSWRTAFRQDLKTHALTATAFSVLFLSHIVWKDYLLLLYFPLSLLFSLLERKKAYALGFAVFLLTTLSSPDVLGAPLAARLDAACIHLWLAVLVWGLWQKSFRSV